MSQSNALYVPSGAVGYELCQPLIVEDFQRINTEINGVARRATWKPLTVALIRTEGESRLRRSDSPWLGVHALIFSQNAIESLGGVLSENGELLPLECAGEELFIFNPTKVLKALDEEASSLTRFDSGAIMMVRNYEFLPEVVDQIDMFKLSNLRVSPTFLSHKFVQLWRESGLEGIEFKRVWNR